MRKINMFLLIISGLIIFTPAQKNKFKLSFTERVRLVTWDNAITLSDVANGGSSFSRIRTNLAGTWMPNKNFEFALKLTNEFRNYFVPQGKDFNLNEIFVDQLYAKYKNSFGTITLGRQNIILGEGFIILDGHPLDGSRSIYFNAVKIDLNIGKKQTLTMFYTYVPEKDDILPRINDKKQRLLEQPETGAGIYFSGEFNKINLQSYYIYKKVDELNAGTEESKIHTLGSRVLLSLSNNWNLTGELAYQLGSRGNEDRNAIGGYAYVDYLLNGGKYFIPKKITLGGIYLSGDDPSTSKVEAWDPVFSRWPKWSESFIYTLIKENKGKVAYWTNFVSVYGKINFVFSPKIKLGIDYHHLMALENNNSAFTNGSGKNRGDLIIVKLNYLINKYLSGHFVWENFNPGNFYFDNANGYNWTRVEFLLKI